MAAHTRETTTREHPQVITTAEVRKELFNRPLVIELIARGITAPLVRIGFAPAGSIVDAASLVHNYVEVRDVMEVETRRRRYIDQNHRVPHTAKMREQAETAVALEHRLLNQFPELVTAEEAERFYGMFADPATRLQVYGQFEEVLERDSKRLETALEGVIYDPQHRDLRQEVGTNIVTSLEAFRKARIDNTADRIIANRIDRYLDLAKFLFIDGGSALATIAGGAFAVSQETFSDLGQQVIGLTPDQWPTILNNFTTLFQKNPWEGVIFALTILSAGSFTGGLGKTIFELIDHDHREFYLIDRQRDENKEVDKEISAVKLAYGLRRPNLRERAGRAKETLQKAGTWLREKEIAAMNQTINLGEVPGAIGRGVDGVDQKLRRFMSGDQ